jgi:urease accessory protein
MRLEIFDDYVAGPVAHAAGDSLVLPFERRRIARQRVVLASGREVALVLRRGTVLRGGDVLRCRTGEAVAVVAAPEELSAVYCEDRRQLARLAYHLGNRHVALEVGDGWVRYARDHVLDDLVRHLGGEPMHETAPFEPEAGAYAGHHHHAHDAHSDHHAH